VPSVLCGGIYSPSTGTECLLEILTPDR